MTNAKEIWSSINALKDRVVAPWRSAKTPLELRKAILEEVSSRLVPVTPGKKVLPFNQISVQIRALDEDELSVLEEALPDWRQELETAACERLDQAGCPTRDLRVQIDLADDFLTEESERYAVELTRVEPSPSAGSSKAPADPSGELGTATATPDRATPSQTLELAITEGTAEHETYRLNEHRINIGRLVDVIDQHGLLKRRNHIAFADEDDETNSTVSREHARILYREDSSDYWLVDDRSAYGTRIFRNGRSITVSSRDRRGIRLQTGDEIYFGRAVARCALSS